MKLQRMPYLKEESFNKLEYLIDGDLRSPPKNVKSCASKAKNQSIQTDSIST